MSSTSGENETVAVRMKKVTNHMQYKLGLYGDLKTIWDVSDQPVTIRRVFDSVREEGEHDYEPQIISIGPIHRDKKALEPLETLKWKYLNELIHRNSEKNKIENYVNEIHSVEEEARRLYRMIKPDDFKLDDNFVEMMVLDGCFLIEFFVKAYNGEQQRSRRNLPLLQRDLLLLENQIPFFILEVLFESSDIPLRGPPDITLPGLSLSSLISNYLIPDSTFRIPPEDIVDIVHLHHFYHQCLRPDKKTYHIPINFFGYRPGYRKRKGLRVAAGEIPSAIQLYNYGVNFKKKTNAECLVDATFDKEEGILEIPIFSLQDAQISTFRNMIAFEQMYPRRGNHITSHAILMTCLIRTPEDVAILRESGIIECMFKKDREVVEVFAQFLRGSYLGYERDDNRKLFEEVLDYCSVVHHKWRADFKRTYFGNPWTVASLIAAILLLLLTFAQTFYTIYAYHHPPST